MDNRPYHECIERFDKPGTFFYIDPPYWNCEDDYGKGLFAKADFERLHGLLAKTKGKWIMSINNAEPIRHLFKDFPQREVGTTYSLSSTTSAKVTELLISNFKLKK